MIPRVLTFVTQFTGTEVAGLEAQLFREFTKLSKLTNLIVITEKSSKNIKNIQILKSISIPIPKLRALIKIISYLYFTLIKQNSYDLVYVRTFSPPELLAAIFAKKFLKKPVVALIPGTWMLIGNGMKKKLYRYLYWKTLNISDRLVSFCWKNPSPQTYRKYH